MKKSKQKIKSRVLSFTKRRKTDQPSVSPAKVARDLFSGIWKEHLDEVRTTDGETQSEHLTKIPHKKNPSRLKEAKKTIRLSLLKLNKKTVD